MPRSPKSSARSTTKEWNNLPERLTPEEVEDLRRDLRETVDWGRNEIARRRNAGCTRSGN